MDSLVFVGAGIGCDLAEIRHCAPEVALPEGLVDVVDVGPAERLRVVVGFDLLYQAQISLQIQFQHDVCLSLVKIDCFRMDNRLSIELIQFADNAARIDVGDGDIGVA